MKKSDSEIDLLHVVSISEVRIIIKFSISRFQTFYCSDTKDNCRIGQRGTPGKWVLILYMYCFYAFENGCPPPPPRQLEEMFTEISIIDIGYLHVHKSVD